MQSLSHCISMTNIHWTQNTGCIIKVALLNYYYHYWALCIKYWSDTWGGHRRQVLGVECVWNGWLNVYTLAALWEGFAWRLITLFIIRKPKLACNERGACQCFPFYPCLSTQKPHHCDLHRPLQLPHCVLFGLSTVWVPSSPFDLQFPTHTLTHTH